MKWLSVSVGYAHENVGGTEMYVHRLNLALQARGVDAMSAYFTPHPKRTSFEGVPLIGLERPKPPASRMAHWACAPQGIPPFQRLLQEVRPDVVHFHGHLQAHAPEYFEVARAAGARTLWTYHAPGQSCLQTALLRNGVEPCDGRIDPERCTRCGLIWSHLPAPVATLFSKLDLASVARFAPARTRHPFERRAGTEIFQRRFRQAARSVDLWVTHSGWCRDLLQLNGEPREKLFNLPLPPPELEHVEPQLTAWSGLAGNLRLLFAGRLLDIKGAHLILEALQQDALRDLDIALALITSAYQAYESPYEKRVLEQAAREPRARLLTNMRPSETISAMAAAHAVIVPSIWLETGPYTVIEALWTGARVVGSRRGGIPERLKGETTSVTFDPEKPTALGEGLAMVLSSPDSDTARRQRAAAYRSTYRARFGAALDRLIETMGAARSSIPVATSTQ